MLLEDAITEFIFDCKVRKLSVRTIDGYQKQLHYLAKYLTQEQGTVLLEEVKIIHVKKFLLAMEEKERKPQYINDLLKVFFKYCIQEEYISSNPTAKIHNTKQPKVLIRTFS